MRLQARDYKILEFVNTHKGITVEQSAMLFFGSKISAYRRLRMLKDNKHLSADFNPFLNCLVYYNKKMPSFHTLVITQFYVLNADKISNYKREAQVADKRIDALFKTIDDKLIALEVVIHTSIKQDKIDFIKRYFKEQHNKDIRVFVVSLFSNTQKLQCEFVKYDNKEDMRI